VRLTPEAFPPGIDTEADLARAEAWLAGQGGKHAGIEP
jgi:3-deoxy-manno-octulosonate cytidylyltransferase (CMP-KDO synthetase)